MWFLFQKYIKFVEYIDKKYWKFIRVTLQSQARDSIDITPELYPEVLKNNSELAAFFFIEKIVSQNFPEDITSDNFWDFCSKYRFEELNEEVESVATPTAATVAAEKTVSEPAASLSSASSHATTLEQSLPHSISLNEVIQKKFLADFRKAFSLNDRFRFRRELFGGDEGRMNEAISDLNELQSFEESITYLDKKLKWNVEDEAVADFIKLLEKRFS